VAVNWLKIHWLGIFWGWSGGASAGVRWTLAACGALCGKRRRRRRRGIANRRRPRTE